MRVSLGLGQSRHHRGRGGVAVADLVARLVGYAVVVFGVVYELEQLGVQIGPLLGALGIVGIALAFALDVLSDPSPAVVFTGFGESSIDFNVFLWHQPSDSTD